MRQTVRPGSRFEAMIPLVRPCIWPGPTHCPKIARIYHSLSRDYRGEYGSLQTQRSWLEQVCILVRMLERNALTSKTIGFRAQTVGPRQMILWVNNLWMANIRNCKSGPKSWWKSSDYAAVSWLSHKETQLVSDTRLRSSQKEGDCKLRLSSSSGFNEGIRRTSTLQLAHEIDCVLCDLFFICSIQINIGKFVLSQSHLTKLKGKLRRKLRS